jgi:hypothetical protein
MPTKKGEKTLFYSKGKPYDYTNMENETTENLRFLYTQTKEEINRYRDWPLKILGFSTVLDTAVIGSLFVKKDDNWSFSSLLQWVCVIAVALLGISAIAVIRVNHRNYLTCWNVIARIQKYWQLETLHLRDEPRNPIFPVDWMKERPISAKTGYQGWGFYALYIVLLSVIAIFILLTWGTCN